MTAAIWLMLSGLLQSLQLQSHSTHLEPLRFSNNRRRDE